MLGRAREGRYTQIEVNRGLPAALLVKYFRQHGRRLAAAATTSARMVEFRELNLARPWPPLPRMDLVFLRNVMIYFDVETKKAILGRVARLLRPDGYLLLGGAETTFNLDDSFRRVEELKGGFYQLIGDRPTAARAPAGAGGRIWTLLGRLDARPVSPEDREQDPRAVHLGRRG